MRTLTPLALLASTAILPAQNCALFPGELRAIGSSGSEVAVGDVNGDGVPDLAMSAITSVGPAVFYVSVLLGDGRGGFSTPTNFPLPSYAVSIVSADVSGDDVLDVAVACRDDDSVNVLLGDGHGSFSAAARYPVGPGPNRIASGDFDGDGVADLAVSNGEAMVGAGVSVLLADGLGGFAPAKTFATGAGYAHPLDMAIGDLDRDGAPDLVVANSDAGGLPNYVSVLLGDGVGGFSAPAVSYVRGARSVAIGDLNRDGAPDVAVTHRVLSTDFVGVMLGDGYGAISVPTSYPLPTGSATSLGYEARDLAIGDANGDGTPDVVVGGAVYNPYFRTISIVSVLRGDGSGGLSAPNELPAGLEVKSVAIADLDGDGHADLVMPTTYGIALLRGNGLAGFAPSTHAVGPLPDSIASADLDGDGYPDLAVTTQTGVAILFGGSGSLAWTEHTLVQAGYDPNAIAIRDLDGDGHRDLIVANGMSNDVSVLRGDGLGGFAAPVHYPVGSWPLALAVDDLNHDGALDAVVANGASDTISVLLGDGHGAFAAPVSYAVGDLPSSVAIGDLDGDGNQDLAVANVRSHGISLLRGDGSGGFSTVGTVGSERFPVAIGDLNGDGRADLVAPGAVYYQTESGTFATETPLGNGLGQFAVVITDVDGDGNSDVVTPSRNLVHVYLGDGHGTFAESAFLAGVEPFALAVDDLNGDGKKDLAVVNSGENTGVYSVTVLLAGCPANAFPYGRGCAGSGGFVPTLALTGTPQPGNTVTITLANGLGGANAPVLVGLSQALLPIPGPSGCALLTSPALPLINFVLSGSGPGQGSQHIDLALPPDLPPVTLTMQGFVLDAGALQGFASSNGLEMHIE